MGKDLIYQGMDLSLIEDETTRLQLQNVDRSLRAVTRLMRGLIADPDFSFDPDGTTTNPVKRERQLPYADPGPMFLRKDKDSTIQGDLTVDNLTANANVTSTTLNATNVTFTGSTTVANLTTGSPTGTTQVNGACRFLSTSEFAGGFALTTFSNKSTDFTASESVAGYVINGSCEMTLPTLPVGGREIYPMWFMYIQSGYVFDITTAGTEKINQLDDYQLVGPDGFIIFNDGSNYYTIGDLKRKRVTEIDETDLDYTVLVSDSIIYGDFATTGSINLLPVATAFPLVVKVADGSTTGVTLNPDGSETIDGDLTRELAPGETLTIYPTSAEWVIE